MKRPLSFLGLTLLVTGYCSLITDVFADRSSVGTSGAVFLKLNAGSRPAGMGEAFAGIADDVNAIYYNPAGTARLAKPEFTAQYGSWFQSINYNALGFVYPAGTSGSFGAGVINLGVDDIERRTSDTVDPEGTFSSNDYAYILHYARTVRKDLSAGVNVKLISQKIDDKTATSYAGDVGILWDTPVKNLKAGLAVQNMGTQVKFIDESDPLPLNVKLGFGYTKAIKTSSQLRVGLDANMPRDNDVMVSGGGEFSRNVGKDFTAAVRAGYKTVSQEKLGGFSGLTAGAGMTWRQFGFDFAWVPYGDLGDTFRYSMMVKF